MGFIQDLPKIQVIESNLVTIEKRETMKSMLIHKQIHKMLIQFSLVLGTLVSVILFIIPTSCTDIAGDGADSLFWEGVELPDQTSFHNPVWNLT